MRSLSIIAVLVGVFALSWTAAAADLELGKKIYAQKCAACHGPDGKGNAKMAETLKVKIPPLTDAAAKTDPELRKIVAEGKKPMPSFGKSLSTAELEAVVHYAKALATGKVAGGK